MKIKFTLALLFACCAFMSLSAKTTKALIVTGQHISHNWQLSHAMLKEILEEDGFDVDLAISPERGEDMSTFSPKFKGYDVVVVDYDGDMWCEDMQNSFIKYARKGKGGIVISHATNNAFKDWEEFNKILALGAFGGRGKLTEGYYTTWRDDKLVKYEDSKLVGHHGERHDFELVCRSEGHPAIDPTLPLNVIQSMDEIYDHTKGPANIKDVLYTAYSETETGGTGRHEAVVFTVDYGKARIFHTMIGHGGKGKTREESPSITSETFKKIFIAGARWAANKRK